jgi:GT2 family glycosyltransferase
MDLSIIIADTNEWHFLQPCLQSVFAHTAGLEFEVIVVDNASTDGSKEKLAEEFPQVKVLRNEYNMGFAGANNVGIRASSARYVLLLNPDTIMPEGAIKETIKFMESKPKAGVIGCKLKYPDGRFQPTTYSFPTAWNMFSEATFLYKLFPKTKIFGGYHLTYLDYNTDVQVDWLIGAYFLMRREVIDTIGILDDKIYMYADDIDYCYRAKQAGFEVWYTPRAEVIHYYGGISGVNKRVVIWIHRSNVLIYQKLFSMPKRYILIAIKYFGLILRTLVYFTGGMVTADKMLLKKSWYALYSIYKIAISHWKYNPNLVGPEKPWKR